MRRLSHLDRVYINIADWAQFKIYLKMNLSYFEVINKHCWVLFLLSIYSTDKCLHFHTDIKVELYQQIYETFDTVKFHISAYCKVTTDHMSVFRLDDGPFQSVWSQMWPSFTWLLFTNIIVYVCSSSVHLLSPSSIRQLFVFIILDFELPLTKVQISLKNRRIFWISRILLLFH